MLLFAGPLLLALGLLSGAGLLLAPFGVAGMTADPTLWVTFPLLSVIGYTMAVVPAHGRQIRTLSLGACGVLLLLALAAVCALVLGAASIVTPPETKAPLWFVRAVGLLLGGAGVAPFTRTET